MSAQNLVAVFKTYAEAEKARTELLAGGVSSSDIQLSATQQDTASLQATQPAHEGGFLSWLFGDAPDEDRNWYGENLREGRTALSVHVQDDNYLRIQELLEGCDPLDVEHEGLSSAVTTSLGGSSSMPSEAAAVRSNGNDEVIPVVKEELEVGKRQTERRFRVRAYSVSRPVEESVTLRDERVVVGRRPVSGTATGVTGGLQDREFEVIETHEEPVVAKTARAVEEVVIHKEAAERVETVRDTVRETKVDVGQESGSPSSTGTTTFDRAAAADKPLGATSPVKRSLGERIAEEAATLKDDATDALSLNRKL
jgi:stress response protein YsnF